MEQQVFGGEHQSGRVARPLWTAMKRGFLGRCPNCGKGRLFQSYLKVEEDCGVCGHHLKAYPADDGPAYFTILIVGHLVIAPILFFPFVWKASPWITVPLLLGFVATVTLALLPRVKGAVIGALWFTGLRKAADAPGG